MFNQTYVTLYQDHVLCLLPFACCSVLFLKILLSVQVQTSNWWACPAIKVWLPF